MIDHRPQHLARRPIAEQRRTARQEHRRPAEILDVQPQLGQVVAVVQHAGRLFGAEIDRLRDQQALCFQLTRLNSSCDLVEEDALVQGVLVDHEHSLVGLQHEERVV